MRPSRAALVTLTAAVLAACGDANPPPRPETDRAAVRADIVDLVADGQRPEGDTFTGVIAFARRDGCPAPG
ncbi:hypothetical protein [Streptomyces griseosporeus]|uniref:hypothetical protein n=1 Tax=Streptomyces griseosporeus TaxID=1910 RepID=UPI0036F8F613